MAESPDESKILKKKARVLVRSKKDTMVDGGLRSPGNKASKSRLFLSFQLQYYNSVYIPPPIPSIFLPYSYSKQDTWYRSRCPEAGKVMTVLERAHLFLEEYFLLSRRGSIGGRKRSGDTWAVIRPTGPTWSLMTDAYTVILEAKISAAHSVFTRSSLEKVPFLPGICVPSP